jgi:hypothetical protein
MLRKRIHVYPINGGQQWGVSTWRGYEAVWHSLRHYGLRVAWYNVLALVA